MYLASVSSCPSRPVLLTRSDPARSTRWSLDCRRVAEPGSRLQMCMVKIQCERVEAWFIGVWGWQGEKDVKHILENPKILSKYFKYTITVQKLICIIWQTFSFSAWKISCRVPQDIFGAFNFKVFTDSIRSGVNVPTLAC